MPMNHHDLIDSFILQFYKIPNYKNWLIFKNNTGFDREKKIHYGIPIKGGFDLFAFGNSQVEFFEGKTKEYPTLSKEQKIFKNKMMKRGFKCWIVREYQGAINIIPAEKYRPFAAWPYCE